MSNNERLTKSLWANPDNPRRDIKNDPGFPGLVASIKSGGIIQPLLIRDDGMILAGHRRHAAALVLELERVPVSVLSGENNHVLIPLIENLQRSDLDVLEVAEYMKHCARTYEMTLAQISEVTGISMTTISKYIKLADAPIELRERIDRDEIPLNAAFELLRHSETFIKEIISTPRLTKQIVRERAARHVPITLETQQDSPPVSAASAKPHPSDTHSLGRSQDITDHLRRAISTIGELSISAPNDALKIRYQRWVELMKVDLDKSLAEPTFRGAVNAFQRQPLRVSSGNHGWKAE